MTCSGMLPMWRMSPSSTLMSGLSLESLWATVTALNNDLSSALPVVWSEWPCVVMMYFSLRFSVFIMRVISPALKLESTTAASRVVPSAMI